MRRELVTRALRDRESMDVPRIAFVSGKGGVGKSTLALASALTFGQSGMRTLVVDMNWRWGALHILANAYPQASVAETMLGAAAIEDSVCHIAPRVDLLASAAISAGGGWPPSEAITRFVDALARMHGRYDVIIMDTPAGIIEQVDALALSADTAVFVMTPDITAIADCYGMLKHLRSQRREFLPGIVVNRTTTAQEAEDVMEKFDTLTGRFLGVRAPRLGFVTEDAQLRGGAVRKVSSDTAEMSRVTGQIAAVASLALRSALKNRTVSELSTIIIRPMNFAMETPDSRE